MCNLLAFCFKLSEIRKMKKQFTACRNTPAAISVFTSGKNPRAFQILYRPPFLSKAPVDASEGILQYSVSTPRDG